MTMARARLTRLLIVPTWQRQILAASSWLFSIRKTTISAYR